MSTESQGVTIRGVEPYDEPRVRAALGFPTADSRLCAPPPRLLFEHFGSTGFVAESGGELVGVLLGFASQTYPGEACVWTAWVRPDRRREQLGTILYECFVAAAHEQYCSIVRASAPVTDGGAIAFHRALGFVTEPDLDPGIEGRAGDDPLDDEARVQFVRFVADRAVSHPRPERETAA